MPKRVQKCSSIQKLRGGGARTFWKHSTYYLAFLIAQILYWWELREPCLKKALSQNENVINELYVLKFVFYSFLNS